MSQIGKPIESFYSNKQDYQNELDRVERHNANARSQEFNEKYNLNNTSSSGEKLDNALLGLIFTIIGFIIGLFFVTVVMFLKSLPKIIKYIYTNVFKKQKL